MKLLPNHVMEWLKIYSNYELISDIIVNDNASKKDIEISIYIWKLFCLSLNFQYKKWYIAQSKTHMRTHMMKQTQAAQLPMMKSVSLPQTSISNHTEQAGSDLSEILAATQKLSQLESLSPMPREVRKPTFPQNPGFVGTFALWETATGIFFACNRLQGWIKDQQQYLAMKRQIFDCIRQFLCLFCFIEFISCGYYEVQSPLSSHCWSHCVQEKFHAFKVLKSFVFKFSIS